MADIHALADLVAGLASLFAKAFANRIRRLANLPLLCCRLLAGLLAQTVASLASLTFRKYFLNVVSLSLPLLGQPPLVIGSPTF